MWYNNNNIYIYLHRRVCIYAYIYIYLYLCYNLEITGQHGHLNIIYSVCNFSASLGEIVRSKNGGTTAAMTAWKPCYEFTRTPCQFQEGAFKSQPIIYIYTVLILIINNNVIQLTMILHTNMYVYILYILYIRRSQLANFDKTKNCWHSLRSPLQHLPCVRAAAQLRACDWKSLSLAFTWQGARVKNFFSSPGTTSKRTNHIRK